MINGFLAAANGVTTSLIQGTQDLIAAVLTLDLGTIVEAALDGTRNVFVALGAGAGTIVTGIESAQFGIATALATPPPVGSIADVSALSAFSTERTVSLAETANAVALDTDAPAEALPTIATESWWSPRRRWSRTRPSSSRRLNRWRRRRLDLLIRVSVGRGGTTWPPEGFV